METKPALQPRAVSVADAAKALGIGATTCWRMISEGLITPVTIGGQEFKRYYFENPSYAVAGLGATYRWRSGRLNHAVTLDVGNVFEKLYFRTRKPGDPRSFLLGYRLKL